MKVLSVIFVFIIMRNKTFLLRMAKSLQKHDVPHKCEDYKTDVDMK